MILSFLTMYRSAKKSSFITCVASSFPHPTLVCLQLAEREGGGGVECADSVPCSPRSHDPASNAPEKVIKYAAFFPTWPNFQGE